MIANQFRYLLLAIDRYTRFPVPFRIRRWASPPGLDARRAVRFLPVAGLIAGLYSAVIYLLFVQLLPHGVATLLAIVFGLLITGGRQESALARFFTSTRTKRVPALAIPGLLVVLLVVLMRVETLGSLDPSWISVALLTAQPLSCGLAALAALGELDRLARPSRWTAISDRVIALGIAVLPLMLAICWFDHQSAFWFAVVPALVFGVWMRRWLRLRMRNSTLARPRFGSTSPDALVRDGTGAVQQISEVAYHLGLLVWWTLIGAELAGELGDAEAATDDSEEDSPDPID